MPPILNPRRIASIPGRWHARQRFSLPSQWVVSRAESAALSAAPTGNASAGPTGYAFACSQLGHLRCNDQKPAIIDDAAAGGREPGENLCEIRRPCQSRTGADADRPAETGCDGPVPAGDTGPEKGCV